MCRPCGFLSQAITEESGQVRKEEFLYGCLQKRQQAWMIVDGVFALGRECDVRSRAGRRLRAIAGREIFSFFDMEHLAEEHQRTATVDDDMRDGKCEVRRIRLQRRAVQRDAP